MLDLHLLVPRLKQVIAWTAKLATGFDPDNYRLYSTVFRQLNPVIDGQPLFTTEQGPTTYTTWNVDVYEMRYFGQALHAALVQRDEQLGAVSTPYRLREAGRILVFETQLTIYDGTPAAESHGFVDDTDVPPLDTWFYLETAPDLRSPLLLCWIPSQFEAIMQGAMDIEMMDSYYWLDKGNPDTYRLVAAAVAA